jgi:kumamolisin
MAQEAHVQLAGSERAPLPGAIQQGPANPQEQVEVTIVLKPRQPLDILRTLVNTRTWRLPRIDREQLAMQHGADPDALQRVVQLAERQGLRVISADPLTRQIKLSGTVADLQATFQTELSQYAHGQGMYRGRSGPLHLPIEIASAVQAVLGLDDRPQAQPHIATPDATPAIVASLKPSQVASLYNFPNDVTGQGQTIAILELGGGYLESDLTQFGINPAQVMAVSVDGAQNAPSSPPSIADIETALDIQVVGGAAPGARIVVYFAPNTDRGFLDAITTAIHDTTYRPSILSISWGSAELNWTPQAMQAMEQAFVDAAALGVTICVAAGDNGSADSVGDGQAHADFPASAPHALACGGTRLDASGSTIDAETVWNTGGSATGGGISDVFDLPAWQSGVGVPPSANANRRVGRGVPDVSGDADPSSGYAIVVGGSGMTIGGTSAVAPLWSALAALLNQSIGTSVGFMHPFLYTPTVRQTCFRDITSGGNGAYQAQVGWDACTGLGSPNGQQLRAAMAIGLGDHFYTSSTAERDAAIAQYGYISAGVAGYVAAAPSLVPLYRLTSSHHFYTTSLAERDNAVRQYGFRAEGIACYVSSAPADGLVPLYRLASTTSGDHLYTTSADERDAAVAQYGYRSEGTACYVSPTADASTTPVFRLANDTSGEHFYTASAQERDNAVAQYGYRSEGIAFYAAMTAESVALYRLANAHHWYTLDLNERDDAIARLGQIGEDVACYVSATQGAGTLPFYRLVQPTSGAHFYTTSESERTTAVDDLGYQLEGTSGYLYSDQSPTTAPLYRLLKT